MVIAILAAVMLAAGCTGQQQNAPAGGTPTDGTPPAGTPGTQGPAPSAGIFDLNGCLTDCNVLVDSGLLTACKAGCHMDDAEKSKDAGKCDPITSLGPNATIFYAGCVWNYAEETGDAGACSRLDVGFDRDVCLGNAAKAKKDPSICDQMNMTYLIESCKEDASGSD